jgi:diguanylate cyclase (GGDEF)-like protein
MERARRAGDTEGGRGRSLGRAPRGLVVVGVGAVALVLLTAFARVIVSSEQAGRDSLEDRAVQRTVIAAHFIEAFNADLRDSIDAHAQVALSGPAPSADEFTAISEMMRFRVAVLLDEEGRAIQTFPADPSLVGADLATGFEHLRRAVDGDAAVTGVVASAVEGEPLVAYAVPYDTPTGRRVFSAGYRAADTPLGAYLLNATVLAGEELHLIDGSGSLITSSSPDTAATLADQDPDLSAALAAGRTSGSYEGAGADRFFIAQPIAGTPWSLVRSLPADAMYAPAEEGRWLPWLLFGGFVSVGLASLWMLSSIMGQRDREERRAGLDALTGVANRRSLDAELGVRLRDERVRWSVLMIDVDRFKAVNDGYGHPRGDAVLADVATTIAASVRDGDVVGRWGGEEFMVIAPGTTLADAGELAERIRAAVASARPGGLHVTASIGVASSSASPPDGLVDLADASLYRAKEDGRNRVTSLAPEVAFPALAGWVEVGPERAPV